MHQDISVSDIVDTLRRHWRTLACTTAAFLLLAMLALALSTPRYEVQAYLDKPFSNDLTELNTGRTGTTGLGLYTPEQVYEYFIRRLVSDEAKQRFFEETYLPAQEQPPETRAARQALFDGMRRHTLNVSPPPPKGRPLYSVRVEAPAGDKAAAWLQAFLDQVAQDATRALVTDAQDAIALQVRNTERDLEERLQTTFQTRQDRQAQLAEALQVAQAVGIREPQMTSAQPPRLDGVSAFIDGSRLYARGTKSLQAELDVLKNRKDDAPFVDGLRSVQAQLRLLKEFKPEQRKFRIFHVDGAIIAPEKPVSPKKLLYLAAGLLLGLTLGMTIALARSGMLRLLFANDEQVRNESLATVTQTQKAPLKEAA